jgi:hypothetical protein
MRKIIPFAIAAAFALGACASGGGASHSQGDAASAITAAEHENSRAQKKGFEWRDTGKLIKKAKEAQKAGDFDKAVKLANQAKNQASNALAQADAQKNAGPNY